MKFLSPIPIALMILLLGGCSSSKNNGNPDGTCIAFCTPGGDECGPNSFCIQYGKCAVVLTAAFPCGAIWVP